MDMVLSLREVDTPAWYSYGFSSPTVPEALRFRIVRDKIPDGTPYTPARHCGLTRHQEGTASHEHPR